MIEGILEGWNIKPHKDPSKAEQGFKTIGVLVDGTWYNLVSKFPQTFAKGEPCSFEIVDGTETLVDSKTFTQGGQPSSRQGSSGKGTTSLQGNAHEMIVKLIARSKEHTKAIEELESKVSKLGQKFCDLAKPSTPSKSSAPPKSTSSTASKKKTVEQLAEEEEMPEDQQNDFDLEF